MDRSTLGIRATDTRIVTRSNKDTILKIVLPLLNGQSRTQSLRFVDYSGTLDASDFLFEI